MKIYNTFTTLRDEKLRNDVALLASFIILTIRRLVEQLQLFKRIRNGKVSGTLKLSTNCKGINKFK